MKKFALCAIIAFWVTFFIYILTSKDKTPEQLSDVIITLLDEIPTDKCGSDLKTDQIDTDTLDIVIDTLERHDYRVIPIQFVYVDDTTEIDIKQALELSYLNVADLNQSINNIGYHAVVDTVYHLRDTTDIVDLIMDFDLEESYSIYQKADIMTVFVMCNRPNDTLLGYVWPIYQEILSTLSQRNNRNRMILSDVGMEWRDPFIHEFGHYCGLDHHPIKCNTMHATLGTSCMYELTSTQLDTMEYILQHRDYQWLEIYDILAAVQE